MANAPARAKERRAPPPRPLDDDGRDRRQVVRVERVPQPDEKPEPAARQQGEHDFPRRGLYIVSIFRYRIKSGRLMIVKATTATIAIFFIIEYFAPCFANLIGRIMVCSPLRPAARIPVATIRG
jgi:hypothetical protein